MSIIKKDFVYNTDDQALIDKFNFAYDSIKKITNMNITNENGDPRYIKHPSNCVVSIEPIKFEKAIYLFGSKQKNLVANTFSVYQAIYDTEKEVFIKGDLLTRFLVTDEHLSMGISAINSTSSPITFTNLNSFDHMGSPLDYTTVAPLVNSVDAQISYINKEIKAREETLKENIAILKNEIENGKTTKKSKEICKNAISHIFNSFYNYEASSSSAIELLERNLISDIQSTSFDIDSTINRLTHYSESPTLALPFNNKDDYDSYLTFYLKGGFSKEEFKIIDSILESNKSLLPEEYIEVVNSLKRFKRFNNRTDYLDLRAGALTFHRVCKDLAISSAHTYGQTLDISLELGQYSNDGEFYFDKDVPVLRLSIDINDLILLLRPKKDSFVLGYLNRFAGQFIEPVKLKNFHSESVSKKTARTINIRNSKSYKVALEIKELLSQDKLNKKERIACLSLLELLTESIDKTTKDTIDNTIDGFDEIRSHSEEQFKKVLKEKIKELPPQIIQSALLLLN